MSQFVEKLKVNFEFRNSLNISTSTMSTCAWNMQRLEINLLKKLVHRVGWH